METELDWKLSFPVKIRYFIIYHPFHTSLSLISFYLPLKTPSSSLGIISHFKRTLRATSAATVLRRTIVRANAINQTSQNEATVPKREREKKKQKKILTLLR